ncbi:MAG: hypothetical protein ACRCX7_11125 [Cetobacterium sp.]|uniref:hypothetical protein n=1 Tax=Cetobacterium sp. TaxID=2071632 RepID=UPI003F37AECA
MIKSYERVFDMLPEELKQEDMATDFKFILKVYASYCESGDSLSYKYGELLDIYGATGGEIDFIGAMYLVFREDLESDEAFRNRIVSTLINRKTPTTLPEMQQAIESVISSGRLYVLENHDNKPCNIYLTGTADSESINRALALIKEFLPAGILFLVPVVSFEKWQNIKDQFPSWESLGLDGYIW